jgi:hypothetical protein
MRHQPFAPLFSLSHLHNTPFYSEEKKTMLKMAEQHTGKIGIPAFNARKQFCSRKLHQHLLLKDRIESNQWTGRSGLLGRSTRVQSAFLMQGAMPMAPQGNSRWRSPLMQVPWSSTIIWKPQEQRASAACVSFENHSSRSSCTPSSSYATATETTRCKLLDLQAIFHLIGLATCTKLDDNAGHTLRHLFGLPVASSQ